MTAARLRIYVVLFMLLLGFVGVVVTDFAKNGAWNYWRFISVVYALISLALSWHLRRKGWRNTAVTLWHEVAHWAGLVGAIFICSYFVRIGLVGRFEASLLALLLLALATFLAGIYIEPSFVILGITLGAFAAGIAFVDEYLYGLVLPITVAIGVLLAFLIHRAHKKPSA